MWCSWQRLVVSGWSVTLPRSCPTFWTWCLTHGQRRLMLRLCTRVAVSPSCYAPLSGAYLERKHKSQPAKKSAKPSASKWGLWVRRMGGKYHGSEHYRVSTHPLLSLLIRPFIHFLKVLHGLCLCCIPGWFFISVFCVRRWLSLFLLCLSLFAFASYGSRSSSLFFPHIFLTTSSIIISCNIIHCQLSIRTTHAYITASPPWLFACEFTFCYCITIP